MRAARRARRGQYGAFLAVLLVVMLGFTALILDGARLLGARSEARAAADLAAHAALVELRRSGGSVEAARARAEQVLARNTVGRRPPVLSDLAVGTWDDRLAAPSFDLATPGNAVEVLVRSEASPSWLAASWGASSSEVHARAVAASRGLHLVVAVDLDPAWREEEILAVRRGLGALLGRLAATAGPDDRVGLVLFHSRYGWVGAPLASGAGASTFAATLGAGSVAGDNADPGDGVDCVPHAGPALDDFELATEGGCFPAMPRVYSDEDGTDLAVALELVGQLLAGADAAPAARAALVLSRDGLAAIGATAGAARAADGYVETRFAEVSSAAGQGELDLGDAAGAAADALWADLGAHVWVVTLGDAAELATIPQGAGDVVVELDAAAMEARIPALVSAFPLGVVE